MSKKSMRRTATSRNERRETLAAKRGNDTGLSEWDNGYGLSVGNYGGLDDRVKRRKKKHPIGFAAPKQKGKRAADH